MTFPMILDIALGLVFIFLVLSLLASELQEILSALLQWRAEHLKQSIEVLLSGNDREKDEAARILADGIYDSPWIRGLNQEAKGRIAQVFRQILHLVGRIYRTVTGSRNVFGPGKTSGPSYIPAEAFANSLLERMQLGQLWQVLADERLATLAADQVILPVSNILSDLKASTGNEFLLNAELKQFEQSVQSIVADFRGGAVSLSESVDRLVHRLEDFRLMAQDVLPDHHPLTETFLRRLDYVKRGLASTPAERTALLCKLRPSVANLLDVFVPDSATYRELHRLAEGNSAVAQDLITRLDNTAIPSTLRSSLATLARRAELTTGSALTQVEGFSREIETWYDRGMERAAGVYRRNAKAVALMIGIATAVAINADSFHIASRLATDPILRSSVVQAADQLVTESSGDLNQDLTQVQAAMDQALAEIPFPLGYSEVVIQQQRQAEANWPIPLVPRRFLGWLVSGFAISMGSTFWFNLLKQVVNIRNTGTKGD